MSNISIGLDHWAVPDLSLCLSDALDNNYQFVVIPIVHPRLRRKAASVAGFTRSDILLDPEEWSVRVVGKLSPYLDVDSPDENVSRRHEDLMVEELNYFHNLTLSALQISLNIRKPYNLVRILQNHFANSHHRCQVWVKVPMLAEHIVNESAEPDDCPEAHEEPWRCWSRLHELMEWSTRLGVVLELTADLPPEAVLRRWLGEPVKALIVPTYLFASNKKGYPVLSRAHQRVLLMFASQDVQMILSGAHRCPLQQYHMYLNHLWERRPVLSRDPMMSFSRGYEDYLQTPLQPLADNLDTHTYNVFEKDPIKYIQYQKAIVLALLELRRRDGKASPVHSEETEKTRENHVASEESTVESADDMDKGDSDKVNSCEDSRLYRIMVLGAGRGPLIRAAFNAADITKSKVQVVAVEKNPCALVSLAAQAREVWHQRDLQLVPGDMRRAQQLPPADIIVSELLGSWADNELSPECLDGAAKLLRPGGISIPCWYTSYAAPITSPSLWAAARVVPTVLDQDRPKKNLENLWVVYMKNHHHIADTKPVFTFKHPAETTDDSDEVTLYHDPDTQRPPDNRRHATLSWTTEQAGVMHGFGGYFDCELFGGEHISIEPSTHSPGMISWFPIFIPIRTPLRFEKGEEISVTFWRCVNTRKVWYEWIASVGDRTTPLHNIAGCSFEMLL